MSLSGDAERWNRELAGWPPRALLYLPLTHILEKPGFTQV